MTPRSADGHGRVRVGLFSGGVKNIARAALVLLMGCHHRSETAPDVQERGAAPVAVVASAAPPAAPPLAPIACAPDLGSVGTLPRSRVASTQPALIVEIARTRAVIDEHKAGTPAVVLRTSDGQRCDRFIEAAGAIDGPFFGFAGSSAAWKAKPYVGVGDFANLVVAITDDHDDIQALYEHEHNVTMDATYHLDRLDVGGAFIPYVTSHSGADGRSSAFVELFGLFAGAPKSLVVIDGWGPTPNAVAEVSVAAGGATPQLDAVTSRGPASCERADCVVCKKTRYAWSGTTGTFRRTSGPSAATCPGEPNSAPE